MLNRKSLGFILIILSLLMFYSCKELQYPQGVSDFEVNTGIPLVYDTLTLEDIRKSTPTSYILGLDEVDGYFFEFNPDSFNFPSAETFIKIPNTVLDDLGSIPLPKYTALESTAGLNLNIPLQLSSGSGLLSKAKLQDIYLKDGTLQVGFTNTTDNFVLITITLPNMVRKDIATETPLALYYKLAPNQSIENTPENLGKYKIKLASSTPTQQDTNSFVSIPAQVAINILTVSGKLPTTEVAALSIDKFYLAGVKWNAIVGNLGDAKAQIVNDVRLPVFDDLAIEPFENNVVKNGDQDYVYFADPELVLDFKHTFGFPLRIDMKPIKAFNQNPEPTFTDSLNDINLRKVINIEGVNKNNGENLSLTTRRVNYKVDSTVLTRLLRSGPKTLSYGLQVRSLATETSDNDFIQDTSKIRVRTKLKLPLYGYINLFGLEDTIAYPLSKEDAESVTGDSSDAFTVEPIEVEFRIDYHNAMPLEMGMQVYFLNARGGIIDSMFNLDKIAAGENLINAATVDANGRSNSVARPKDNIPIKTLVTKEKFDKINDECKNIIIRANIKSSDFQNKTNSRIFPTDYLIMQFSIRLNGKIIFGD